MTDLTAITTPFGLLDRETQEALKAHGGPYEAFFQNAGKDWAWQSGEAYMSPDSHQALAWRVKPAPTKPREWWLILRRGWVVGSSRAMPRELPDDEEAVHVVEKLP
jgi:hypothetical protein